MRKKRLFLMVLLISAMMLVWGTSNALASGHKSDLPKFITISSYPVGSLGTVLATAFSNTIEKKTGIRARPTPADSDVGRVLPVKTGEAQVAVLTAATVYFASNGLGEFDAKSWGPQKLRLAFAGNVIHHGMAVKGNSDIKTWADLKGKRVAFPPGLFLLTAPAFLAYGGLDEADIIKVRAPGYTGAIKMVMDGSADACHACPVTPLMTEWETAPYGLRYLPMSKDDKAAWARMREIAPFMASPIWCDYAAMGIGGPKWLAFYPYTLTAYDTTSEAAVYAIVKALVDGRDIYKGVKKPASEQWTLKDTLNLEKPVYVPFHPGLIKYAKEQGQWTEKHEAWQADALKQEQHRIQSWTPTK
jgi:TRAP transporter TAXI family solute receptor